MIECVFSIYETYFREISIGFFSSILTLGFLFSFKPRIKISKKIACKSKGDSYRIKIVNKNYFFSFINIKAELQIIYSNNNPLESAKNIHLLKNYLFQITSNKICNKEYRNAYRFVSTTKIKDLIRKQGDNFKCLRFRIIATHSFTNFSTVKVIEYDKSDLITGEFEIGNSLKIIDSQ